MIEEFLVSRIGETGYLFIQVFFYVALVAIPWLFIVAAVRSWMTYKKARFHAAKGFSLLEIKVPRDVAKSPLAMELVLESFHQTGGETTPFDRAVLGKTRAWFSLEIVSIEGNIHFFVWTRTPWKKYIETAIYSQYPDAEVYEVEDYTNSTPFDLSRYTYWGCHMELTKPDPYPIKTYIDYGLDKDPKEEYRVDPMNSMLEFLGSLRKGEQVWIQIIIRAHKKEKRKPGTFFGKTDWKEEGKKIIEKILKGSSQRFSATSPAATVSFPSLPSLTSWETDMVKAIERNLSKHGFDTGIRILYIAENEVFDPINISGLLGTFKQYSSEHLNGFKPARGLVPFNYPWQDYKEFRQNKVKWQLFDAYHRRSFFWPPYRSPWMVLSNEELATIFHIPSETTTTPTLPRVSSRKADAPSNLPQ